MGFTSVILVGHDDGGLLALRAAQRVQTSMNSYNVSNHLLFLCRLNLYTPKEKGKKRIFLISPFRQKKDHIISFGVRSKMSKYKYLNTVFGFG